MNDAQVREYVLNEAKGYVLKDRNSAYGTPEDNFNRIAKLWDAYDEIRLAGPTTPTDVSIKMILMKVARLAYNPKHRDSWTDIAGYAACGAGINLADIATKKESVPLFIAPNMKEHAVPTKSEPGIGDIPEEIHRLMADPDEAASPYPKLTGP